MWAGCPHPASESAPGTSPSTSIKGSGDTPPTSNQERRWQMMLLRGEHEKKIRAAALGVVALPE